MKFTIAPIVERHGDVAALPILLRMLAPTLIVARPVRFPKSKLLITSELQRAVKIARSNIPSGEPGLLLLVIDTDADCAASMGTKLLSDMHHAGTGIECFVAVAVPEFESWIVGGHGDIDETDPENPGTPKARISRINHGLYRETADQPRFTTAIDSERLRTRCPSFLRLAARLDRINKE